MRKQKVSALGWKNITTKTKISMDGRNSRMEGTEEGISALEDRKCKLPKSEQREKQIEENTKTESQGPVGL